ncbi:MAG TPA: porin [Azospirillum sp.]|nr:porin [Azospirillum sp.]
MSRYLLAGCAAVALTIGSSAAKAQAKFEVKMGGDAYMEFGLVGQDNDGGLRSTEMRNRFRLNIIPAAKADNGLEYGGRIRIRSNSASRNMDADRAYIFAQGTFGQVRAGVSNTFQDETMAGAGISRPIDYLPFSIFDQGLNYVGSLGANQSTINGVYAGADVGGGAAAAVGNSPTLVWPTFGDVATRVVYFSPRLAGVQFGASYTPRSDSNNTDSNRLKTTTVTAAGNQYAPGYQDLVEVGVNVVQEFNGVSVKALAAYQTAEATKTSFASDSFKRLSAWTASARVGYAGFSVGGSYTDWGKSLQNGRTASGAAAQRESFKIVHVGAQYTTGPLIVGAGWMHGQDPGSNSIAGKRKVDAYEVGVSYTVAPGLAVQAQYDHVKANSDKAVLASGSNPDDKANVVILRTTLAF